MQVLEKLPHKCKVSFSAVSHEWGLNTVEGRYVGTGIFFLVLEDVQHK
jgi:hypothetical protein